MKEEERLISEEEAADMPFNS